MPNPTFPAVGRPDQDQGSFETNQREEKGELSSRSVHIGVAIAFAVAFLLAATLIGQRRNDQLSREEQTSYYAKWLAEDVVYLITEEEKATFLKLTTDDERDSFIEQFWFRRNPDPRTAFNEFREEHYRRIAFANENFTSGVPGWKTHRGEMYIKFGPPDGRETHPNGGPYVRRMSEGGGSTVVHPFERWRYNYIDGIGSNVEIEFVDPSRTGEFRIALSPQEKDALLYVGYTGKTEAEELGIEDRWMRITRDFGLGIQARSRHYAVHPDDFPFQRLERLGRLQQAPVIRFRDLKTEVATRIAYALLPLDSTLTYIQLTEGRYFVPITVSASDRELGFQIHSEYKEAVLQVYGAITDLAGRLHHEFDREVFRRKSLTGAFSDESDRVLFQHTAELGSGRYLLEIVVKDARSGKVGLIRRQVHLPHVEAGQIHLSPLVLADAVESAGDETDQPEDFQQFHLGEMRVVPNVVGEFFPEDTVHMYLQAYAVHLDQATLLPDLSVRYFLLRGERLVRSFVDLQAQSIRYVSPARVVLSAGFRLHGLDPGEYRVLVRVNDRISGQETECEGRFQLKEVPETEG